MQPPALEPSKPGSPALPTVEAPHYSSTPLFFPESLRPLVSHWLSQVSCCPRLQYRESAVASLSLASQALIKGTNSSLMKPPRWRSATQVTLALLLGSRGSQIRVNTCTLPRATSSVSLLSTLLITSDSETRPLNFLALAWKESVKSRCILKQQSWVMTNRKLTSFSHTMYHHCEASFPKAFLPLQLSQTFHNQPVLLLKLGVCK